MKQNLVIVNRSITLRLPVDVCYKHYTKDQVEYDVDQLAQKLIGDFATAYLEDLSEDEL